MNEPTAQGQPSTEGLAQVVYILYLVGIVFGLTGIVGVVIAYVNRGDAPEWLQTHYQFQIRTFWIGAIYLILGAILAAVVIGYLVLLFWLIWLVVRCVKGMKALEQKVAYPNPTGWMF